MHSNLQAATYATNPPSSVAPVLAAVQTLPVPHKPGWVSTGKQNQHSTTARNVVARFIGKEMQYFTTAQPRVGSAGRSMKATVDSELLSDFASFLHLRGPQDVQDFLASLVLSECVYKKVDMSPERVAKKISQYASHFPAGWVQLDCIQLTLQDIPHQYLVCSSDEALYVAFMGTKQARDIVTDVRALHEPVWEEALALAADTQETPAAHSGFLQRARCVDVERLYDVAQQQGRRLVLCGHSLGGAVAKLCALRLLRELPEGEGPPALKCFTFATPAVGNAALARLVESAGWAEHFSTYHLPEDQLMRMLALVTRARPASQTQAKPTVNESIQTETKALQSSTAETGIDGINQQADISTASQAGVHRQQHQPAAATVEVETPETAVARAGDRAVVGVIAPYLSEARYWARIALGRLVGAMPSLSTTMSRIRPATPTLEADAVSDREAAAVEEILAPASAPDSTGQATSATHTRALPGVKVQPDGTLIVAQEDLLMSTPATPQHRVTLKEAGPEGNITSRQQSDTGIGGTSSLSSSHKNATLTMANSTDSKDSISNAAGLTASVVEPAGASVSISTVDEPPPTSPTRRAAPMSMALSWALQKSRALRHIQKMIPLQLPAFTAPSYHTFGQYLFLGQQAVWPAFPDSAVIEAFNMQPPTGSKPSPTATAQLDIPSPVQTMQAVQDQGVIITADRKVGILGQALRRVGVVSKSILGDRVTQSRRKQDIHDDESDTCPVNLPATGAVSSVAARQVQAAGLLATAAATLQGLPAAVQLPNSPVAFHRMKAYRRRVLDLIVACEEAAEKSGRHQGHHFFQARHLVPHHRQHHHMHRSHKQSSLAKAVRPLDHMVAQAQDSSASRSSDDELVVELKNAPAEEHPYHGNVHVQIRQVLPGMSVTGAAIAQVPLPGATSSSYPTTAAIRAASSATSLLADRVPQATPTSRAATPGRRSVTRPVVELHVEVVGRGLQLARSISAVWTLAPISNKHGVTSDADGGNRGRPTQMSSRRVPVRIASLVKVDDAQHTPPSTNATFSWLAPLPMDKTAVSDLIPHGDGATGGLKRDSNGRSQPRGTAWSWNDALAKAAQGLRRRFRPLSLRAHDTDTNLDKIEGVHRLIATVTVPEEELNTWLQHQHTTQHHHMHPSITSKTTGMNAGSTISDGASGAGDAPVAHTPLHLLLRSDFQQLCVPVQIHPMRVAALYTSDAAREGVNSVLQAVVSSGDPSPSTTATGLRVTLPLRKWLPALQRRKGGAHDRVDIASPVADVPSNVNFNDSGSSTSGDAGSDSNMTDGIESWMLAFPIKRGTITRMTAAAAAAAYAAAGPGVHTLATLQSMAMPDIPLPTAVAVLGLTAAAASAAGLPFPKLLPTQAAQADGSKAATTRISRSGNAGKVARVNDTIVTVSQTAPPVKASASTPQSSYNMSVADVPFVQSSGRDSTASKMNLASRNVASNSTLWSRIGSQKTRNGGPGVEIPPSPGRQPASSSVPSQEPTWAVLSTWPGRVARRLQDSARRDMQRTWSASAPRGATSTSISVGPPSRRASVYPLLGGRLVLEDAGLHMPVVHSDDNHKDSHVAARVMPHQWLSSLLSATPWQRSHSSTQPSQTHDVNGCNDAALSCAAVMICCTVQDVQQLSQQTNSSFMAAVRDAQARGKPVLGVLLLDGSTQQSTAAGAWAAFSELIKPGAGDASIVVLNLPETSASIGSSASTSHITQQGVDSKASVGTVSSNIKRFESKLLEVLASHGHTANGVLQGNITGLSTPRSRL